MSFFKKLFGGGAPRDDKGGGTGSGQVGEAIDYKGYSIKATPFAAEGQYQTCGVVSRVVDGALKEHRFIRADRLASKEAAAELALRKGQQMVDEQGDHMFG